jgi:hypothetical protein
MYDQFDESDTCDGEQATSLGMYGLWIPEQDRYGEQAQSPYM